MFIPERGKKYGMRIDKTALSPRITLQRHLCHSLHIHAWKTELLNDFSLDEIDPIATERVLGHCLWKMDGVEKMAVRIDEGTEMHPLPFYGAHIFNGNQQSQHAYGFTNMGTHVVGQDISPELCPEQVEIGMGNGKPKQFDFVVHLGEKVLFKYRKFESLNCRWEEQRTFL